MRFGCSFPFTLGSNVGMEQTRFSLKGLYLKSKEGVLLEMPPDNSSRYLSGFDPWMYEVNFILESEVEHTPQEISVWLKAELSGDILGVFSAHRMLQIISIPLTQAFWMDIQNSLRGLNLRLWLPECKFKKYFYHYTNYRFVRRLERRGVHQL